MFIAFTICATVATTFYLYKTITFESSERFVIDRMNRRLDDEDPLLFTGNSRKPNV